MSFFEEVYQKGAHTYDVDLVVGGAKEADNMTQNAGVLNANCCRLQDEANQGVKKSLVSVDIIFLCPLTRYHI